MPGERLHDGAGGCVTGDGEGAHRAEADAGRRRADLLPAAAGAARHVELGARTPPTDPHETEVAHRRAGRPRVGLEMVHGEPGLRQLERMPGPDDAAARDDGPAAVAAHRRRTIMSACVVTGAPAPAAARAAARMASAASHGRGCPKMALPATNTLAPAATGDRSRGAVDPSIDLDVEGEIARGDLGACLRHLRHDVRDEALATETGEDRHAQEEVDVAQVGPHRVERRVGIERHAGPQAEAAHLRDELVGVPDLDVHRAAVRPGVGEVLQVAPGLGHHEVAVEEQRRVAPQRRHHRRPDRHVRHEVPVHHVDVEPVGRGRHLPDLLGQQPEVGRQHRRGDAQRAGATGIAAGCRRPRFHGSPAAQPKRAQQRMRRNP